MHNVVAGLNDSTCMKQWSKNFDERLRRMSYAVGLNDPFAA